MNRFRCHSRSVADTQITIDDPGQLHHLKVLRLSAGETVGVFDERGNEYECRIADVTPEKAVFAVTRRLPGRAAVRSAITVAVAIPKKSKIDDIIDKLTQVGADRIIPLITERVIVRPSARDLEARVIRWKKIAEAAVLQSRRNSIPRVDHPAGLFQLLEESSGFDLKLIPTLDGDRKRIKEVLAAGMPENILALIGPEGDFSPAEISAAKNKGFIPVSFGANVLRVETAAVYITSILAYEFHS